MTKNKVFSAAMAAAAAMAAIQALALGGKSAQDRFAIFPPHSTVQCVINGKAIESFPAMAALNGKFVGNAALAGKAIDSPLKNKVSFFAFAATPIEGDKGKGDSGNAGNGKDGYDDDDDFEVVLFAGLAENTTFGDFRSAVLGILPKLTDNNGKPLKYMTEELAGGGVRVIMPEIEKNEDGGTESGPAAFCLLPASPSIAVVAEKEETGRGAAEAIGNGKAISPAIPSGNTLAWLSASIDPMELFGGDDDDDDSPLEGMEFLSGMTNIMVIADGDCDSGAINLSVSGRFAGADGASAAAGMLSALLQMAALSGEADNPLAALGKRSKVIANGGECRLTAIFPKREIEAFLDSVAAAAEAGESDDE